MESDQIPLFLKEFNLLAFARGLYQLDVSERLPKETIKEMLSENSGLWEKRFDIAFDLDNIDFGKKGFTRYYPFAMEGKDYIIRIFSVKEKHYLPKVEVFYEGVFEDSRLGFQVIPGVNTLLNERKAEKIPFFNPAVCSTHP